MKNRRSIKILVAMISFGLLSVSNSAAQNFKRFEFLPYAGFSASGDIPVESEENVSGDIHVSSSLHAGAAFYIYLNELDAIGIRWQRQFTDGTLPAIIIEPAPREESTYFNLNVDQYHADFVHHFKLKNPEAKPYIMAGLGATTYYANRAGRSNSASYFSFALGGGMKYFFNDYFGFRGEARWNPTVLSTSGSSFWCSIGGEGAACIVDLKATIQNQLDLTGGIVVRF